MKINGRGNEMKSMAHYEMQALMAERATAMETPGMPLWPPMELVFQRLPQLKAGLAQARAVIEVLEERPELAPYIPPAGLD